MCTLNVCSRDVSLSFEMTTLLNSGINRYVELALSTRLFEILSKNNITLYAVELTFFIIFAFVITYNLIWKRH